MTTSARLLSILAVSLPLAACAAQPGPAAQAPAAQTPAAQTPAAQASINQAAKPGQDAQAGGAAPASAAQPAAAQSSSAQPAAPQSSQNSRPAPGVRQQPAGSARPQAAAPAAPAAPATVPAPAANAPVLDPASPAAPETTVGGGAANRPVTPPSAAPVTMPSGSATGSLLQTLFALIVVLAVLGALAWFLKRYGPKAGGGSANLRVVGALNLGGRERVLVIEVGSQWIVVGASPGRINALATMPRQDGLDTGAADANATLAPHTPPSKNFGDWLKQTIDKRK
jgi:flagellar biosynthetic protein FliO